MLRFRSLNALPALLIAALTVVFAAGCAGSQQAAAPPPSGDAERSGEMNNGEAIQTVDYDVSNFSYSELPDFQVPDVEKMTLDNGLTVFLLEDHELPTVSASARIGTGEVWAPADKAGLASMTGIVMRSGGTQSMAPDELNQFLKDKGASVETSIGEVSGRAYMNTLAKNVDQVLPVFEAVLAHPAFTQDKVEEAKSQTRTVISRRNDNSGPLAKRELKKLVYGADSPYARVPQYYTIDGISREDLKHFHDQYFHPSNTLLSVWGDFDAGRMKRKIRKAFGSWKRAPDFERPALPQPEGESNYSVHLIQKDDVNQSIVRMGYLGELTKDDPDYFPVTVMNEVLSAPFTGRLFQEVRTRQGLAYSAGGAYIAGYGRPGYFFAQTRTKSGTTVEAARSVLKEIKGMRQAPPSQKEVQLAKDAYLNSFVFNFDTRREILSRLMTYDYYDYPRDFLEQTKKGISSVTPDDVYRVSKTYLHPGRMNLLVLGRSQDFDQPLSALTKGGRVDTMDISIPTSAPGEQEAMSASKEDRVAGRKLLAGVRAAMGGPGAFDDIQNMRQATTSVVPSPQGEQTIKSILAAKLPGRLHAETTLPNGITLIFINDGEQMTLQTPRGTQPAPPPIRKQINGQLHRNLVYLMTQAEDLKGVAQGTETMDGTAYQVLKITLPGGGKALTLYVDPDTMLPARMEYQGMNPRSGPFQGANAYADYREVDGVMVPYETISYKNGEKNGTTTVTDFETNVDFKQGYFSTGQ